MIAACVVLLAAAPVEVAHRRVVSSDGASLALYRYGPAEGNSVLLVPELGEGRVVFDAEGEGLARYLASHGRTAYVAELRGQGASFGPGYDLSALVARDLPAIVEAIGAPQIDLVAHGYAGTLALAATAKELKGRVGRVVAIATPVLAEIPSPLALAVLSEGGDLRQLAAEGSGVFELLFSMHGRFRSGRLEVLRAHAFSPLGLRASHQLLAWMRTGDLQLDDGTSVLARLSAYDRPTLLLMGLADGFANPEFSTPLPQISKANVKMRTFSRADLASEDYSHLSLLQGKGAETEVFRPALAFLNEGSSR